MSCPRCGGQQLTEERLNADGSNTLLGVVCIKCFFRVSEEARKCFNREADAYSEECPLCVHYDECAALRNTEKWGNE